MDRFLGRIKPLGGSTNCPVHIRISNEDVSKILIHTHIQRGMRARVLKKVNAGQSCDDVTQRILADV